MHHIIIRGIERRKIFRDDKDKENLIDRLSILLPETQTACYAWAFMSNHAHFLFRSGSAGISTLMRRLLTGYAIYFNRRYFRHGQLFQNRFKSIICQEDVYFKEIVRYIHLNQLRAKIVSDIKGLNKYPYSGHSVLMGKKKQKWCDTEYVFSYFGKKVSEASEQLERRYKLKGLGYDLKRISERVSKIYGIAEGEIYSRGRRKAQVEARDLLCYWAVRELGMSCTDVAKRLGMSQSGVGYAVGRGEKIAKKHEYQLHK